MGRKVCGTRDGITACQMDIKVDGLSYDVLAKALEQARQGRLYILDKIHETIPEPREDYKDFVPRIEQIKIPKDFIGAVIGKGGEVIQKIQAETNTIINIEEEGEFGIVDVASQNKDDIAAALKWIKDICTVPEVGDVFDAKVVSIVEFGAFMEFLPGKEGLMHISEYEWGHPETLEGSSSAARPSCPSPKAMWKRSPPVARAAKVATVVLAAKVATMVTAVVMAATVANAAAPATGVAVADS